MNKLFYPAFFCRAEEGGFWITFPDLPECITEGDDMEQAYEMATDALGLAITSRQNEKQPLPIPSAPDQLVLEPGSFPVIIEFDLEAYRKRTNSKAVKKTLTIPEWLNEEALAMNINFSQLLQEAIVEKLKLANTNNDRI